MNPENLSAEDKLLKLIKNPAKNQSQNNLSEIKFVKTNKKSSLFNINTVNKFLSFVMLAGLVLFCINIFFVKPKEINTIKQDLKSKDLFMPKNEPKDFSHYQEIFKQKDLFTNSSGQANRPDNNMPEASIDTTQIIKDITLLGIISGEKPQAVVEDKKTQKTYFLNPGDFLGEAKLIQIKEGKVTFQYQGKNFELFL